MALIWCILYALQPLVGILIVSITGKAFHMDSMYGILVPFAFCQGPGQASTYGRLFEYTYGFDKAEMVALTYAIFGFLSAFLIGVPFARYGLKKGLARNKSKINEAVERGYFVPEEQREPLGKSTFHSANIETAAAHFAIMGVCYLLALVLAKLVNFIPALGSTFSAMLFMWGMFAAYIVKAVMIKLNIEYLINNALPVLQAVLLRFSSACSLENVLAVTTISSGCWVYSVQAPVQHQAVYHCSVWLTRSYRHQPVRNWV